MLFLALLRPYCVFRSYRNETDSNQTENIFRQFENLKNTNKELMMYMSVLASMVDTLMKKEKIKPPRNASHQEMEQFKIMKVLVNAHRKDGMKRIIDQEITKDYVKNYFSKI